ncbi:MAG: thiamine diphosphokinase [Lachnospiraceae bacterium]|nr:thiamine diphosphokinase [Lachnospiraceae bacterium]
MYENCLIISGGEFSELPDDIPEPDHVIACDRGWKYARILGYTPDLIVGDFDSSEMPPEDMSICHLPVEKDDTDTMYAARIALKEGCRSAVICCAFGGRLDHTLANIQTGAYLASEGVETMLVGTGSRAVLLAGGETVIPRKDGWSLSVLSLSDVSSGVTIKGTKYECEDIEMTGKYPLGVSNTWASGEARISVKEGMLMIIFCEC